MIRHADHSERRKRGIRAIIALQKMADIEETSASAGKAWDSLSDEERDKTLAAYAAFCNRGEESQSYEQQ